MSEKIEIQFNDKPLQVEKGARLIEVCASQNLEIPRFCYHPGLSVVASCRMCQVEVEGPGPAPRRLAVSCRTDCAEGMKVWTHTDIAQTTRRSVLEFLLKNHPLDCPICDKAGECPLQNYTYQEGQASGRSEEPRRDFRKRVDLGEKILLDEERCVLCSRCVRFTDEVAKDPQLMVRGRAVEAMVGTLEDEPLRGNYQGNLADICPVGALTLKKFRFQARVWNLKMTPSICPHCSKGCNISVETHRGRVVRIRPRVNPEVNGHWMCDIGRFGFDDLNQTNRLNAPLVWDGENYGDPGWESGLDKTARLLSLAGEELLSVGSPYLTQEEGKRFLELCSALEIDGRFLVPEAKPPDHLLYTGEQGPNQRGLKELGLKPITLEEFAKTAGARPVIYLAGENIWNLLDDRCQQSLEGENVVILQDTLAYEHPGIDVYLPAAHWSEKTGSFVNGEGQVQRIAPAMAPPRGVRLDSETFESLRRRVESGLPLEIEVEE